MAYTNRGVLYELEGDHGRAVMDFDHAIELDPKLAKAYANRGASYLRKGDVDGALADFDRGIELEPRAPEALAGRAQANLKKGFGGKSLARCRAGAVTRSERPVRARHAGPRPGGARPSQRSHRRIQEGARHQADLQESAQGLNALTRGSASPAPEKR